MHFNSIKVRLELKDLMKEEEEDNNFNSIKVRLERRVNLGTHKTALFQFHKGTIRTKTLPRPSCSLLNFNSIKVRLEQELLSRVTIEISISIP